MNQSGIPKISVIVLSYNFEIYIAECIESILVQTLKPFEIIICDDYSTDDSWSIIKKYHEEHPRLIKAFRHVQNMGISYNGTFSKKKTKGDWISWIDGDDRWLPEKLEFEWSAILKNPDSQIAYSNVYSIDSKGNKTDIWWEEKHSDPPSGNIFIEVYSRRIFSKNRNVFRNQLMSRLALEEIGYRSDINLDSYWDWDEKIRLSNQFPIAYSGAALVEYRQHDGGFSKHNLEMQLRGMIKVYEKHQHLLHEFSAYDAARVQCSIEILIALQQVKLNCPEVEECYNPKTVFNRIQHVMISLSEEFRKELIIDQGVSIAYLSWELGNKELRKLNFKQSVTFFRYAFIYIGGIHGFIRSAGKLIKKYI